MGAFSVFSQCFILIILNNMVTINQASIQLSNQSYIQSVSGVVFKHIPDLIIYESTIHLHYELSWADTSLDLVFSHPIYKKAEKLTELNALVQWSQQYLFQIRQHFSVPESECLAAFNHSIVNANLSMTNLAHFVPFATRHLVSMQKQLKEFSETKEQTTTGAPFDPWDFANRKPRNKRDLSIIGSFLSYCCGVVSKSDFNDILASDSNIKAYFERFQSDICANHDAMEQMTHQIANYGSNVTNSLLDLRDHFEKISKLDMIENNELQVYVLTAFETISLIVNHLSRDQAMEICRQRRFPLNFITVERLQNDIDGRKAYLLEQNFELAFAKYWQIVDLPLTTCKFAVETFQVTIKLPVRRLYFYHTLYEVISLPFAHLNTTCMLHDRARYLAEGITGTYALVDDQMTNCDPLHSNLCQLARFPRQGSIQHATCIEFVFLKDYEAIKHNCGLHCSTQQQTLISQIDSNLFSIIFAKSLYLKCKA